MQVVAVVEALDAFENLFLAQAGVFERALLEAVGFHQGGLVFLGEPAVERGLLVQFRARIRRGQENLHAEYVQLLRKTDRLLEGFPRFDGQSQDEGAVKVNGVADQISLRSAP